MPWSSQICIGERVSNYDEIKNIFKKLGDDISNLIDESDLRDHNKIFTITVRDKIFTISIQAHIESESGAPFPTNDKLNTGAAVMLTITGRYSPEILDLFSQQQYSIFKQLGRPDPFYIDIELCKEVLEEVHRFWPDAQLMIMDMFY